MTQRKHDHTGERTAGSRLPYSHHVNDRVIALRDGSLVLCMTMQGLLFETADTSELNYRKNLRDAMLKAIGSSRFAVYYHVVRRKIEPRHAGEFADAFSRGLNQEWQTRISRRQLFSNDLFVTLVRRRAQSGGLARRMANLFGRKGKSGRDTVELSRDVRDLEAAGEQLVAALSAYSPRFLASYNSPNGMCSEPLEFFSCLYNGTMLPARIPAGDLGEYAPARRISFGQDTLELGPTSFQPASLGAMVSIKDYPNLTAPGMLDELLRLPVELTISQSFAFVDRGTAQSKMNLALRRMQAADDDALSLRSELAEAKDAVAANRAAYGEHHFSVHVRGADQATLDLGVAEVQACLAELGIMTVREELGLEPAFWAQFPGNFKYITRPALIGSANFASLASGHNFPTGRASGNHWGSAVTLLETTAASPYYFNFHHRDLGNFTVIGPSGSGKTVILNFLLSQSRRFSPRMVFFDKDRGAEIFIRAVGGHYRVLRPGEPSGLNPLQMDDTAENRHFLCEWIGQLVKKPGQSLSAAELSQIEAAVHINYQAPQHFRKISVFVDLLRGSERPTNDDLYARLRRWWGDGENAWLFDNDEDGLDLAQDTHGFDMTRLLDDPVTRVPAMMYLFHRIDQRLDGKPSIIVVDEGWKALDDDVFTHRIRDWEKTIRKRNGIVGFATQNASDALKSRIAGAIVEQSATQIFTANPKAQAEDYMEGFGLTEHEFDLIRSLPDTAHCFLIKHANESVVARLDLSGQTALLTVLSGNERTVRLLDEIRMRTGDDPADWLPELHRLA